MERECFEDKEIGKILSDNFVCIKLDREERPDVDKVYMTFVQWQYNRATLESSGQRIIDALKKGTTITANPGESPPLAPDVANRCFQQLAHSYEEEYGGFRDAPKFPSPGRLTRSQSALQPVFWLQQLSRDTRDNWKGNTPSP
ncbi:hypothetical protein XENOCAPTIV_020677 [Xenoophorus captivus]|uniref:Spermatogenesis-associated protein 20-like TRX domain-containing protein n=1 Tax=Xenoophorus captivus TaxID=1517983 RepID=A0ABV0SAN1_9TELE